MAYEFRLPDVGEGISEAEIVRWLVQEGEHVKRDEPLVEIETDKAVVEVPAPVEGTVVHQGGHAGDTLHVGDLLAVLDGESGNGAQPSAAESPEEKPTATPAAAAPAPSGTQAGDGAAVEPLAATRRPLATPVVRKLARELSVDLTAVHGTGAGGRISAEDVQGAASGRVAAHTAAQSTTGAAPAAATAAETEESLFPSRRPASIEEDERVPLRGLRRRIAESMALSWRTIPHITGMDEVEVSELVSLRDRLRERLEGQGIHLSYLPFVVKAVVAALKLHPIVNACLDGEAQEIVYRHRYNIGIATATADGLIVPVLHDADRKTLRDLAAEINSLSEQARSRAIALPGLQNGTFTITNFGSLGGWLGTPIIRPGEAAILGVGRIQERPWVVDGRLEVRPIMALSFSADHRLIDGDIATAFMRTVAGYLGDPLTLFAELI